MAANQDPAQEIERLKNELQARQMSIRQLESLLQSQNWMKEHAEGARDKMRGELKRIAGALCSQMVNDSQNESPDGLSAIGYEELTDMIIADIQSQIDDLETSARDRGMSDADSENVRLQRDIIRLKDQIKREKGAHEKTRERLKKVQSTLDTALATSRNTPDTGTIVSEPAVKSDGNNLDPAKAPEWLAELQQWSLFDPGVKLLQLLAETGMSRRLDVSNAYGDLIESDIRSSSVRRVFPELQKQGLIDIVTVDSETLGASTQDLVRLSNRGKDAYRLLFHQDPVLNEIERLLPQCETLPKVLLVLEAAEILQDAGYAVDVAPNPIAVSGQPDRRLALDMKVSLDGEMAFIMVEGKDSDAEDWKRKWQDYYDAIGDSFYIVVASEKIKSRLLSNVSRWVQKNKCKLKLQMTNISIVRGKGRRGNEIWMIRRNLGGDAK